MKLKQYESFQQTVADLTAVAGTSRIIGMESFDRSFRPIRDNEIYELLQAASRATSLWLFIFKPNPDMFGDKQESLAHIM